MDAACPTAAPARVPGYRWPRRPFGPPVKRFLKRHYVGLSGVFTILLVRGFVARKSMR